MLELIQPDDLALLRDPQPAQLLQRHEQDDRADPVPSHDGAQADGIPGQHGEGLGGARVKDAAGAEDGAGEEAPDTWHKRDTVLGEILC